jgi:hypothetical protein
MLAVANDLLVGALRWNPTVRGILFPAIMFIILVGGTYMIMATNLGNRLGFLVAAAGLSGWMALMAIVWMIYAIGLQGRPNVWHVEETMVGKEALANSKYDKVQLLADEKPLRWKSMPEGNPRRGDAQSVTDNHLGRNGDKLFDGAGDYVNVGAWNTGGEKFPLFYTTKKTDKNFFRKGLAGFADIFAVKHTPNFFVIQVQPVLKEEVVRNGQTLQEIVRDAKGQPKLDTRREIVSVVMERDLGSKRLPGFILLLSSGTLFGILCMVLHKRDQQVMAAIKALPAGAKA